MLDVAMFLLMAVGVMGLAMVAVRMDRRLAPHRVLMAVLIGVGFAWLANLNLWTVFSITHLRAAWIGVTLTGIVLGGASEFVHAVYGFFAGLHRKFDDQAEQLEQQSGLRRVA